MVELKRLEATVAELEDALKEGDWDAACTDLAVLKLRYAAISAVKCKLEEDVLPKIARFVVRANEPDPEKRVYGPGTVTKIVALAQRIAAVEARVGEVYPQLADSVGAVSAEERVTREAAEAEKRAAQVAAAELAEAQAAATAAAAREAEERRRAEAHAVAEKLREEQAAKARAKEAEKKAEESKKAASVSAAFDATASEDKQRAEREEKNRKLESVVAKSQAHTRGPPSAAPIAASPAISSSSPASSSGITPSGGGGSVNAYSTPTSAPLITYGIVNEMHTLQALTGAFREAGDSVVIVDFMAPWCGPCRAFAPTYAHIAGERRDVAFLKVDCDAVPEVPPLYGIRAFPTFQTFFRGKQCQSFSGAVESRLRSALEATQAVAEETLTAEAIAASLSEPAAPVSGAGVRTTPFSGASSTATTKGAAASSIASGVGDEESLLHAALQLRHDGGPLLPTSNTHPTGASSSSSSSASPLLQAVAELEHSLPPADFTAAARVLFECAQNILVHPSDAKYRRLRKSNPAFNARLGRHGAPADAALRAMGFVEESRGTGEVYWVYQYSGATPLADVRLLEASSYLKSRAGQSAPVAAPTVPTPTTPAATAPAPTFPGGGFPAGFPAAFGGGGGGGNADMMRMAASMLGQSGGGGGSGLASLMNNPMVQQALSDPAALQAIMGAMGGGASPFGASARASMPATFPPMSTYTAPPPRVPAPAPTPASAPVAAPVVAGGDDEDEELQAALRMSIGEGTPKDSTSDKK